MYGINHSIRLAVSWIFNTARNHKTQVFFSSFPSYFYRRLQVSLISTHDLWSSFLVPLSVPQCPSVSLSAPQCPSVSLSVPQDVGHRDDTKVLLPWMLGLTWCPEFWLFQTVPFKIMEDTVVLRKLQCSTSFWSLPQICALHSPDSELSRQLFNLMALLNSPQVDSQGAEASHTWSEEMGAKRQNTCVSVLFPYFICKKYIYKYICLYRRPT